MHSYQQAADLYRLIDDRRGQAANALKFGNAHLDIPALRNLDRAEQYYRDSLALLAEHDQLGRAHATAQLGSVAVRRFYDAYTGGVPAIAGLAGAATKYYQQALALLPADAVTERAVFHHQLGLICGEGTAAALTHFQEALRYREAAGDRYYAGGARYHIAILLFGAGRHADALAYARAAFADYASYGPSDAADADEVRRLIAKIEQAVAGQQS